MEASPRGVEVHTPRVLRAHADVVRDSVWGHHHTPSVRVLADGGGAAVHTMYLSPSLTPRNPPHDPGVRLYAYDRATGELRNYTDFTFDVRRANHAANSAMGFLTVHCTHTQPPRTFRSRVFSRLMPG